MNWRRGFNRIYFLLACVWLLYWMLIFPMGEARESSRRAGDYYSTCRSTTKGDRDRCLQEAEEIRTPLGKIYTYYLDNPADVGFALAFLLAPPAVVYMAILGVAKIIKWIARGFSQVRAG
jgi:hypothetical protein